MYRYQWLLSSVSQNFHVFKVDIKIYPLRLLNYLDRWEKGLEIKIITIKKLNRKNEITEQLEGSNFLYPLIVFKSLPVTVDTIVCEW